MPTKSSTQALIAGLFIGVVVPFYLQAAFGVKPEPKVSASKANAAFSEAKSTSPKAQISCSLSASKILYKVGESPKIQVRLHSEGDKAIYLVGSLDGSEEGMRYPYCSFEISDSHGKVIKPSYFRCGNTNPLRPVDFIKVEPKSAFNPYMQIDDGGFFGSYQLSLGTKIFSKPGRYKLRFSYSTASPKIENWLGDGRLAQDSQRDAKLIELFRQVPKLSVKSNELVIRFVR